MPEKAKSRLKRRGVVRVTRSPMNPLRWCLQLECGHDIWVTAKTKPARKFEYCEHVYCVLRAPSLILD